MATYLACCATPGVFVGHFFGRHDSWADTADMTFQTRDEVEARLSGFDVHLPHEQDEDGPAGSGPKHWHVFHRDRVQARFQLTRQGEPDVSEAAGMSPDPLARATMVGHSEHRVRR